MKCSLLHTVVSHSLSTDKILKKYNKLQYILYSERSGFNMSEIIYFPHDHHGFTEIFN